MGRFGRKTRLTFERIHVARNIEKPLLGTCRKVLGGTKRMLLSEMAFSVVQPDEKARVYNLPPPPLPPSLPKLDFAVPQDSPGALKRKRTPINDASWHLGFIAGT